MSGVDQVTGCKICGRTLVRKQKIYCSYTCKWKDTHKSVLVCRNCGKTFELWPSEAKRRFVEFCDVACKLEFSDREVKRLRSEGKPLISVLENSVICNVCGRKIKTVGSHMGTHGVKTMGMGHLERNLILGIGLGERAVPPTVQERMRDTARIENIPERGGPIGVDWHRVAHLRSGFPVPESVRETCIKNAHAAHEAACVNAICKGCGKQFVTRRAFGRKYCSTKCAKNQIMKRYDQIVSLRESGHSYRSICNLLGVSRHVIKSAVAFHK